MAQLDDLTKKQILDFVKNDVYDEIITLKYLKCDYEETVSWDIVDETGIEMILYNLFHIAGDVINHISYRLIFITKRKRNNKN